MLNFEAGCDYQYYSVGGVWLPVCDYQCVITSVWLPVLQCSSKQKQLLHLQHCQ